MTLPASDVFVDDVREEQPAEQMQAGPQSARFLVLLVDDDDDVRLLSEKDSAHLHTLLGRQSEDGRLRRATSTTALSPAGRFCTKIGAEPATGQGDGSRKHARKRRATKP